MKGIRFIGLLSVACLALTAWLSAPSPVYAASVARKLNFNLDWRFIRTNAPGAELPAVDTAAWKTVSCPHTWNDVDTFSHFSAGGHTGESELWTGVAWYRKEFTLPKEADGKKVFIEFEGVRQIADVYLNGQHLGQDKIGFVPFGFDLTPHLKFGATNVLAVRVDNRFNKQYTGDTPWNHPNWHPPHGGIYRNVYLHVTDPLHVTLPLYAQLATEGIKDYHAPKAKFVLATGCGNLGRTGLGLQIAEAQLAVGDAKKHPEFAGNVKCIDSRGFWPTAAESPNPKQDYHYYRNADTYMNVGLELGWAMTDLLKVQTD